MTMDDYGTTESEIAAIFYEMNSPLFSVTSNYYQQKVLARYYNLTIGYSGY